MIYKMYVRPIMEFGCVLFSGSAAYKMRQLILLEREALRLCLGLPKFVANNVLYVEARLPPLLTRFRILTVQTFLKIYNSPLRQASYVFIQEPTAFFGTQWSRLHSPQIRFVQALLEPLNVNIYQICITKTPNSKLEIKFDDIFPSNAKQLPLQYLNIRLKDYLTHLSINNIIATDASVLNEKAGIGIFCTSLDWSFSVRLPDYTPIFIAELFAIILALRKLPASESEAVILTDSLSVCTALSTAKNLTLLSMISSLLPENLKKFHLLWIPGHCGIYPNEMADSLAKASLSGPLLPILPDFAYVTALRYRKACLHKEIEKLSLDKVRDFVHLRYCWNKQWCVSRQLEITITRLRCRIPHLNYYLHKAGLTASPLCLFCKESESIDHFFLSCQRYAYQRKRYLVEPIEKLGLKINVELILSFGGITLGYSHREVFSAVCEYIRATKRLPC